MINLDFNEFIKNEARHKSKYVGSDQSNSHKKMKTDSDNSSGNTDAVVGAAGRDIFKK
ncbi:hypothetical protein [Metabacillus malikii]|uniref:Uncharacterized protein n=1 Tax=Metabacillus malikii TaxID=1504265 RepID=A0ABT9ZAT1_9BACI|nr:hypothetical protein [Metabacillus malikii]MDQ0228936.1 hypothetical protein [Metabacillus malikii]